MPQVHGMPAATAAAYRSGGPDAYGNPPERQISDGTAPCRCCLGLIPKGGKMLVLAHRPFSSLQPYAETGPVFLCARPCTPGSTTDLTASLDSPDYLLKAYFADERILYGTGQITPTDGILSYADSLLARPDVAFVDLRSARNSCWLARLTSQD